jgi:hypothetical protein
MGWNRLLVIVVGVTLAACGRVEPIFIDAAPGDGGNDDAVIACDQRACSPTPDSCCPTACDANNDIDCAAICGNDVLEPGERCDPLSSCPTDCPASGCSLFTLEQPGTCFAQCVAAGQQTACMNGDSCCPTGCNANNDSDCSPACDNGVVESGESCDPLSSCPGTCPQLGCQLRTLQNAGTCTATCASAGMQTSCIDSDGCCPSGCNANNDSDCMPGCGNGVIETGETCDPLNTCPSSCPAIGCQLRTLQNPGTCMAACANAGMQTACANNDGCCPTGCNANNDSDCMPTCGNSVIEAGETCDPPGSCPTCTETYTCYQQTGSAATCNVRCHLPVTTCGINGDSCCAFDGGGGCSSSTDGECSGQRWEYMRWPSNVAYRDINNCEVVQVYDIDAFGTYDFTFCNPGDPPPPGDPVITSITDNTGHVYNVSNDDCTDPTALPLRAGWRCENAAGSQRLPCASPSPGGFQPASPNVYRLDIRVCPYSGNASDVGIAPFYIWYNARNVPSQG